MRKRVPKSLSEILLVLAVVAVVPVVVHASAPALSFLSDDDLNGISAMRSPSFDVCPDDLGGIKFIYSGITGHTFENAKGIITVIQVPGSGNVVAPTINVNIFVYLVEIHSGGTVVISIPEVALPE